MNKQEAIKTIEQDKIQVGRFTEITREVNAIRRKIEMVDYVPLETVVSAIDKINEPEKVVVPRFVKDWLKKYRHAHTLLRVLNAVENEQIIPSTVNDWILDNQYDFIKAWLDGCDIEKEEEADE